MAYVRPNLNEIVAEMPVVQARVKGLAMRTEAKIKAIIAPHNKTGHLFESVSVERAFKRKDWWIYVSASYAVPANYGHVSFGRRIEGINFIKGAVYSVGKGR